MKHLVSNVNDVTLSKRRPVRQLHKLT